MAGNPYLSIAASGLVEEKRATQVSAGAGNADQIVALSSNGLLDPSMLPPGVVTDVFTATAFEALAAGDFVYVRPDGQIAKAIATSQATLAMAFVLQSFGAGAVATAYLDTKNTSLTGLTPGSTYFLSDTTAGQVTTTPVTTAGRYLQNLGRAVSASMLTVEIQPGILRG